MRTMVVVAALFRPPMEAETCIQFLRTSDAPEALLQKAATDYFSNKVQFSASDADLMQPPSASFNFSLTLLTFAPIFWLRTVVLVDSTLFFFKMSWHCSPVCSFPANWFNSVIAFSARSTIGQPCSGQLLHVELSFCNSA